MAGFCRNCGSPLDDAQAFCAKCGTPVSGPPVRSSAPPPPPISSAPPAQRPQAASQPRPPAPAPAPQAAAAAPPKSGSNTFVKVLLIFVVIIFVFGAIGVAGIWYVAHRVKQKVHEIGLDDIADSTNATRGPALAGIDPCSLLSKSDVGQAVKIDVVRAEPVEGSDPGCQYSVMGEYVDLIAKHAALLQKEQTTEAQRQTMESFAKSIGQGANSQPTNSAHPGESPVFIFSVGNSAAKAQMSMTRSIFGRMGPAFTELPAIGDEAFDIGNAMILARKGDKVVRIMYMMCPCTREDAVPLARKIVSNM
jgi:zinc-ribbon domain